MAIITQYRTWNGIQTEQKVNTETGRIEVFAIGSGLFGVDVLIASSEGKGSDWKLNNPQSFTDVYNRRNHTRSSVKEVERAFFLKDYKVLNGGRAEVLKNPENFPSYRDYVVASQRFFDQKTPGITDPKTRQTVSPATGKETELEVIPFVKPGNQTEIQEEPPSSRSTANGQVITADKNAAEQDSKPIPPSTPIKPAFESVKVLRYPLGNLEAAGDIAGITYDYIKISIQDWVSSISSNTFNNKGEIKKENKGKIIFNEDAVSRYKETKGNLKTIILPMTNGLGTQNGISWGESNGNSLELALAAGVGDLLKGVSEAEFKDKIKAAASSVGNSLNTAKGFIVEGNNQRDGVAALLAGYVIGNTSFATRTSGLTINPNMELLFSGPKLRSFGFQFEFAPRFREEAEQVREIIKTFKKFSAPVIGNAGDIFLKTPKIFQLEYIYNGDGSDTADGTTHPYLNKIKPCALTNVGVNYTPNGTYMTYAGKAGGGSMVQTTLTLSFSELEPIYNIDYDDGHPTGY